MIDASIPLQARGIDGAAMLEGAQRLRLGQMQVDGLQQQHDNRRRLADLLPRASQGDRSAIDELYSVNPEMAMKLDAQQREAVKARTDDITQAVRWADTPDKWEQVIQHYQQEGVDLSQYRGHFEMRERALMELGKMGQYLSEAPKQEFHNVMPGAAGVTFDPHSGKVGMAVQANPGTAPQGAPASGLTDDDIRRMEGGQSQSGSGNFPGSGYGY